MGILFKLKKKLLTKTAMKAEKRKLIKEAQARIENDELKQLQSLKSRIGRAKNINIPQNLKNEIKARKATRKKLLKQAGKNLKVGARSAKTIFKELKKLGNAPKVKRKIVKKKIKRRKR